VDAGTYLLAVMIKAGASNTGFMVWINLDPVTMT